MSIHRFIERCCVLLVLLWLSSCAHNASEFIPAPQAGHKSAIIYVYRPSSTTNFLMSPAVVVDANEAFTIGSGEYRYVYLAEGEHTVGLGPSQRYSTDAALRLSVTGGRSYYLRVHTSLKFVADGMNTRRFWLEQVGAPQALEQLASTRYAGEDRLPADALREGQVNSEGFTIEKTRDPFAGRD